MTTLPNMSLVLPTRGAPGSGAWADTLDSDLTLTDAHDHSSGKGVRVPSAGLNINADISFASLYAPKNLHRAQFSEIAGGALSGSHNLSLFVSDGTGGLTAHELYFRTSAGNFIKFTSGSSLNVSAFTGGIGGDYTAVSALVDFDDANKQYRFRSGGGTNFARVTSGGLRLIEFGTSETLFVGQIAPAGLAASYTMTWPTALPGSAQIAQIDSGGQVSFSNTIGQAVTFSAATTFSALATLNAGATAGANQNITVSGTGTFKQGTKTLSFTPQSYDAIVTAGTILNTGTTKGITLNTTSTVLVALPPMPAHFRLIDLNVKFDSALNRAGCSAQVVKYGSGDPATQTTSNVGSALSNSGTAQMAVTGLNAQPSSGEGYWLSVTSAATSPTIISIVLTYDVP